MIYVLEFATCLVLRDAETTEKLGKRLASILQSVVRNPMDAHYIVVSRTVYYLFSLLHASYEQEFLNTPVVLHLIANLDKDLLAKTAESTIKGLKRCVGGPGPLKRQMINSPDFWVLLRSLLKVKGDPEEIFEVLKIILDEQQQNVTADNYEAVISLLSEFATAGSACASWEQKQDKLAKRPAQPVKVEDRPDAQIYKLSASAVSYLLALSGRVPELIQQSHLARPEAWAAYWMPLFLALAHQCANPARHIRHSSFAALQRIITSAPLQPPTTPSPSATQIFTTVLFPLLAHLLKPETYHSDPRGMSETRLQAATMLTRIFLHYLVLVPSWPSMLEIWEKIIDVCDRLINSGQGENLEEAVVECLKNAVLVMSASGFLVTGSGDEGKEVVWERTWKRIERLVPGLQKELGLEGEKKEKEVFVPQTDGPVEEPSVPAGEAPAPEVTDEKHLSVASETPLESRTQTPHLMMVDSVTGSMV